MSKVLDQAAPATDASPASAGTGVTAPPADGSAAASPAASPVISWETAPEKLRTEYEQQKAEAARLAAENGNWKKLGDYERVNQLHSAYEAKVQQVLPMGRSLGYTEQQIRQAMLEDPKGTAAYLQQEYSKPTTETRAEQERRLESLVNDRVKPIQERFDETINREANARYEGERDRLFKTEFVDGLPDDNREEFFEILDGLVANDPAALQRLKFQNQVSDVARHMAQAKTIFMKRHTAYIAHERGRGSTPPPTAPGTPPAKTNGKFSERKISGKLGGGTVGDFIKNL